MMTPDIEILACPETGEALHFQTGYMQTPDGGRRYRISGSGIPLLCPEIANRDAERQRDHYDAVAAAYAENLTYPHTQEYLCYLDEVLIECAGSKNLGRVLEICCGAGEADGVFGRQISSGLGVDISEAMLEKAIAKPRQAAWRFVQGDATRLPVQDACIDTVVMLGGIHHVNDRQGLFREVSRVLKPGGRFIFREPLDDYWLWRSLRWVIYRLAPALDHETERPLRHEETAPYLRDNALQVSQWRGCGFIGFCLFMNSDVLVFNRLFRFLPGIRKLTRLFTRFDEWCLKRLIFRNAGLQVVGIATKDS